MRAIVVGATGHIGAAICHRLVTEGWFVTAASRRSNVPASLANLKLDFFSVASDEALRRALTVGQYDWLVDAAAPYPLAMFRSDDGVIEQACGRTRWLLEITGAVDCGYAYVSSFTTLVGAGEGSERWRRELGNETHPYFRLKQAVEAIVLNAEQRTCVVNPTMCLGPWDGKRDELALVPMLLSQRLPSVVDHVVNVVDVRDVAAMMFEGLRNERLQGIPLLVTGHNTSLPRLVREICQLGNVPIPRFETPMNLGLAASVWFEAGFAAMGQRSPSPALALLLVAQHRRIPVNPLQQEVLGDPLALSRTLADTVAWHQGTSEFA